MLQKFCHSQRALVPNHVCTVLWYICHYSVINTFHTMNCLFLIFHLSVFLTVTLHWPHRAASTILYHWFQTSDCGPQAHRSFLILKSAKKKKKVKSKDHNVANFMSQMKRLGTTELYITFDCNHHQHSTLTVHGCKAWSAQYSIYTDS